MQDLEKYISSYFGVNENIEKVSSLFIESDFEKREYFVKADHL